MEPFMNFVGTHPNGGTYDIYEVGMIRYDYFSSMIQKFMKLQGRIFCIGFFFSCSSSSNYTNNPITRIKIRRRNLVPFIAKSIEQKNGGIAPTTTTPTPTPTTDSSLPQQHSPLSGLEDVMMGYIFGQKKATEVAHLVWRHIVQKGDTLVDATCGNGYDTLAMVKMVSDKSHSGHVYAMDLQKVALENTSSLLDESLKEDEKGLVKLFSTCHSKMEEVVPKGVPVRLVAFNLGYLPGGDKAVVTTSETTLQALEAAKRILATGGLISLLVVYVGHPGGREEFDAVQTFAAGLPVENWICCKLQMLNRPLAPVLVLLLKR